MEAPNHEVVVHALKNPLILKHIFRVLASSKASIEDLKSARRVDKSWNTELLSLWRNDAVVSFQETPFFRAPGSQGVSPSRFWEELQNPQSPFLLVEKPFQKYKFTDVKIDLDFCIQSDDVTAFWNTVGPLMKQLTLKNVKFNERSFELSIPFLVMFMAAVMPNLEVLIMEGVSINRRPVWARGPPEDDETVEIYTHDSVKVLNVDGSLYFNLTHYPNLEEVTIHFIADLPTILVPTRQNPSGEPWPLVNTTIKRLDIINCLTVRAPSTLRLPALEHLTIALEALRACDENEVDILAALLTNHAEGLRSLQLFNWLVTPPPSPQPGVFRSELPVLTELHFFGNVAWDLGFLQMTPNLRLLHVDYYGFGKKDDMDTRMRCSGASSSGLKLLAEDPVRTTMKMRKMRGVVLPAMESLHLNCPLPPESIRALGKWMPNLKTLKVILNSKCFAVVCEVWKGLAELQCLFHSNLLDKDMVTGLSSLKKLKRFHYDTECGKSVLTDKSVTKGFLQLPELIDLQICVSEKFSETSEATLQEKIQNVSILRNYATNPLHENWKCCLDSRYRSFIFDYQKIMDLARRGLLSSEEDSSQTDASSTSGDADEDGYFKV